MQAFNELCEAIRKSMQEMNSPEAIKAQGEAFVKNLQKLESTFNTACQEAKDKKKKEAFPDALIWDAVTNLAKDVSRFLKSLEDKASLESLTFLQTYFATIERLLTSLSKSKFFAQRRHIINQWHELMIPLNAICSAIKIGNILNRITVLQKQAPQAEASPSAAAPKDVALDRPALQQTSADAIKKPKSVVPVADLMTRFNQIFSQVDSTSELSLVKEALTVLEEILALDSIDSKETGELREMVFTVNLGEQLDNIIMSLTVVIRALRAENPENCFELQNCVKRLSAILANPLLEKHNTSSLEDVNANLRDIENYMTSSVTFAAVLCVLTAVSQDKQDKQGKQDNSVAASASVEQRPPQSKQDASPERKKIREGKHARAAAATRASLGDTKETDEIDQVRAKCSSVEQVFTYYNLQRNNKHIVSKDVLIYLLEIISGAHDAHKQTFDKESRLSVTEKKRARMPWEQVLRDIGNEKTHTQGTLRHLMIEITARFHEFNLEHISRLCYYLSNCDLLYTAFHSKLEQDLMGDRLIKFSMSQLEKDCNTACRNARFGVKGLQGYPSIQEMTNIAQYLQHMGCDNPDLIHKIILLASTSVANVDRTRMRLPEAAMIGNLSHSIGLMSHYYLASHGQIKMTELIRKFHEPVLIFGAQLVKQGFNDDRARQLFRSYKRGVGSLANNTRAYADKEHLRMYDSVLQICLEELQTEKPCLDQTYFASAVRHALTKSYHLSTVESEAEVSNGKNGKGRISLKTELLIAPFQYDFLLSKGKNFFTIEANGRAYHYLISIFSDEQCPPRFDILDGKSRLKRSLVHGKCLKLLPNENAKKVLAIDIHQTEFEKRKASHSSFEYIQELIEAAINADQAEVKAEAEAKARAAAEASAKEEIRRMTEEEASARAIAEAKAKAAELEARAFAEAKAKEEAVKLAEIHQHERARAIEEARAQEEMLRTKTFTSQAPEFQLAATPENSSVDAEPMMHQPAHDDTHDSKESAESKRLKFLAQEELYWLQVKRGAEEELSMVQKSLIKTCKNNPEWIPDLLSQTKAFACLQEASRNLHFIASDRHWILQGQQQYFSVSEEETALPPPLAPQRVPSGTINFIQINNTQFSPQFNMLNIHAAAAPAGLGQQQPATNTEPVSVDPLLFTRQAQSLSTSAQKVVVHGMVEDSYLTVNGTTSNETTGPVV